jgi:hypothetical protein
MISTRYPQRGATTTIRGRRRRRHAGAFSTAGRIFRLAGRNQFRRRPKRKSSNLRKDHLEVLALTLNPSRNLVPESKPRGRGQFLAAYRYRCWVRTRDSKTAQPATLLLSVHLLYHRGCRCARGVSKKLLDSHCRDNLSLADLCCA